MHTPAAPVTEFTRNMVTPGITAHELATLFALPACIQTATAGETPDQTAERAKAYATAALAHRIGGAE